MQNKGEIEKLIYLFSRIPGFGPRSSRRAVLHLLKNKDNLMLPLAQTIHNTANETKTCINCFNLDSISPCQICSNYNRDHSTICVVESVRDLWALERGKIFKAVYHVLGGNLSASNNITPDDLNIEYLVKRIAAGNVEEVILATNATIDGQTTAFYITEKIRIFDIKISQLAHGIPIGGELDYLDEGTLSAALRARHLFE